MHFSGAAAPLHAREGDHISAGIGEGADRIEPIFSRDGVAFGKREILGWATLNPPADNQPDVFEVESLAPGFYEVCRVPITEYSRWAYGYRDPRRCVSGHLAPLGQLDLTLPAEPRAANDKATDETTAAGALG